MANNETTSQPGPLAGIRVIEMARILAGPWAGQVLADLGADVIKIEAPQGDDTRKWGPPFVERSNGDREAAYFHCCNRGKRSIVLDFKEEADRKILLKLVSKADVLIENFKVGGLAKYGLDYESLKARYSDLIYCSVTGFGQKGPYATQAGYDFMIQGMAGIMDLTGDRDGEPQKVGVAFADIFTGLYSVIAIQSALHERNRTGEGCHLDMALMDCQTAVLANQATNYLASGNVPTRMGNAHPNIVPYQVFEVSDGHLIVAVGNDEQFVRFCEAIGRAALCKEKKFETNAGRVEHRDNLVAQLAPTLRGFSKHQLTSLLNGVNVPVGPINRVNEVFDDPQILHRQMQVSLKGKDDEEIPAVRIPIVRDGKNLGSEMASPTLNQHGDEILQELGWFQSAED